MKSASIFLIGIAALFVSCRSSKDAITPEPVVLTNTDNVRTERVEKLVIDTVKVFVEIPAQSASNQTMERTSHLETDFAESDAWLNPDGTLGHNLFNKPQKIASEVQVPHKITESNISKERSKEIPVPYPVNVYVEKELSKWQQFRIDAFWYLICALAVSLGWTLRNPLTKLFCCVKKIF